MNRLLMLLMMAVLLVGCSSIKVKNKTAAQLIPESVAKEVLVHYFGSEWVYNPRGEYIDSGYYGVEKFLNLCGDDGWGPLPLDQINNVQFNSKILLNTIRSIEGVSDKSNIITVNKVNWILVPYIPCRYLRYTIYGDYLKEEDAHNIAEALVSLGAKIKEEK